jgi:protein-disulfide isomerase
MKKYLIAIAILFILGGGAWWLSSGQEQAKALAIDPSTLVRAHSPTKGRSGAPVVIVEFFDPACGTCRSFHPMVQQLMQQYPNQIRLVMRYAPFHKGSDQVVTLLAGAQKQGLFWQALEALFEGQDDWASNHTAKVDLTWKYLDRIGLNKEQLAFDMTAPEIQQAVAQDLQDANTLGVSQTPEYFVNGRPLPSFGFEQLQQLVSQEVSKVQR